MKEKQLIALIHVGILTVSAFWIVTEISSIATGICNSREQTEALRELPRFGSICTDLMKVQVGCLFPLVAFWPTFYKLPSLRPVWGAFIVTSAVLTATLALKFWNLTSEERVILKGLDERIIPLFHAYTYGFAISAVCASFGYLLAFRLH